MSLPSNVRAELYELAARHQEGSVNEAERTRLQTMLQGDAEARRYYAGQMQLAAHLRWTMGGVKSSSGLQTWPVAFEPPFEGAARIAKPVPIVTGMISSWGRLGTASKMVGLGVSGLLVTYFALLMLSVVWDRASRADRKSHERPTVESPSFATLTRAMNCRWKGEAPGEPGDRLAKSLLTLEQGIVELRFETGAKVTLEGPAEFDVRSPSRGFLKVGKLVAMVPEQAIGFTVETPTATVVDLGTEFAVEIDERGATEVQVLKGKIELHPNGKYLDSSSARQRIVLIAGEARRIEPSGENGDVIIRNIVAMPDRLTPRLSSTFFTTVRQIPVQGAVASSTHPLLNVYDLINGSGLNGDRHSAAWEHTMWHTAHERVKQEFVLFDLFRPRRLDSMKVWNFNDASNGRSAWTGVKQADIYVSTSGKEDPLSQPGEWKLVVADQQFAPGPGLPDYDTPTIVALNDVEGRFVAIVIEDAWGYGPHPTDPSPDVVGLSEVQFFGTRLDFQEPQSAPKKN